MTKSDAKFRIMLHAYLQCEDEVFDKMLNDLSRLMQIRFLQYLTTKQEQFPEIEFLSIIQAIK